MRAVITILAVLIAIVFGVSLATRQGPEPSTTTPAETAQDTPAAEQGSPADTPAAPPAGDEAPAPATSPAPTATAAPDPIEGLRVQPAEIAESSSLGSIDRDSDYAMRVDFTGWGAAIKTITLSQFNEEVVLTDHEGERRPLVIQDVITAPAGEQQLRAYAFAAQSVTVNGTTINLETVRWHREADGHYSVTLVDGADQPVLRIDRRFVLSDLGPRRGHDLTCFQTFRNLSGRELQVQWNQNGQAELEADQGYLGDRRQFIAGYYNLRLDANRFRVYTDGTLVNRADAVKSIDAAGGVWPLWPSENVEEKTELAWIATVNRYFAVALHQPVAVPEELANRQRVVVPGLERDFPVVRLQTLGRAGQDVDRRAVVTVLRSRTMTLAAGATDELNIAMFAGPRDPQLFAQAPYSWMHFNEMIRYEMGCAWCTFQPLARGLLWFLRTIYSVVRDWGVAIIILVLVVRLVLHPITKRSQINMTKMGKAMQAMQPEMEKIRTKYKDNPQKLQAETMRLYREKGVNPANLLGCLPMFLQMPLWIALYAMLAFAIELRHQPAFYGIFQTISGGSWGFLSDLSSPDRFIRFFEEERKFFMIDYSSLNLLPLLMGVVFYFNMKLTTPPPANEQAAQQQKIMKWMTLLFPLILYSAPSGLTLYILASTGAGMVDSYFVRRHIKREEEAGTLFAKKEPKPGGFMDRMRKAVEERQRQLQQLQEQREREERQRKKKRK